MIQWFPGHMAKAIREMQEKIKLVDLIFDLTDARVPLASQNPVFEEIFSQKLVLHIMTKADKADKIETERWINHYPNRTTLAIDSRKPKDIQRVMQKALEMMAPKRLKDAQKGLRARPIKVMIVGIPNVGKSTLINSLVQKKVAAIGDKPGVTKVQQWIRINQDFELLDTPGVLWPKFADQQLAINLAITGAIKDNILRIDEIASAAVKIFTQYYPSILQKRYALTSFDGVLEQIAQKYSLYTATKALDIDKAAETLLQEYRHDLIGPMTLDRCPTE